MKPTDQQIEKAYKEWVFYRYRHGLADKTVELFLSEKMKAASGFAPGFLQMARKALLLPMEAVAEQMGISRAAYAVLEKNEAKGSITLASLARAAEAMDCELVYMIRPKGGRKFSEVIWKRLIPLVLRHGQVLHSFEGRKVKAIEGTAGIMMYFPRVRQKLGWSKLKN